MGGTEGRGAVVEGGVELVQSNVSVTWLQVCSVRITLRKRFVTTGLKQEYAPVWGCAYNLKPFS